MKNKRINKPKVKEVLYKGKFTVVKFMAREDKLFECIPDIWFVDENRENCFWPPKTGKSFTLRAISGDMPDDSWSIYSCEIISENHPSYSDGFKVVREKVTQRYNTSSADDELQAAMFRRKHPGLVSQNKSFECVFKKDRQPVREVGEEQQTTDTIIETSNCENHGHEERTEEGLQENGKNTAKENRANEIVTLSSTESVVRLNRSRTVQSKSSDVTRSTRRSNRSRSRSGQSKSSDTSRSTRRSNRSRSRSGQSKSSDTSRSTRRSNRSRSRSGQSKSSDTSRSTRRSNRSRSRSGQSKSSDTSRSTRRSNRSRSRSGQSKSSNTSRSIRRSNSSKSRSRSRSRSSHRSSSKYMRNSASQLATRSGSGSLLANCDIRQAGSFQTKARTNLSASHQQQYARQDSAHSSRSRSIQRNALNLAGHDLVTEVKELKIAVRKVSEHLTAIDRRFDRLEVTVNKTLILVGDATRGPYQPEEGSADHENDEKFDVPSIPIRNTKKLAIFQRKLKNKAFRAFLINREKEFCGPSGRQTDTVVMTKYLQRFISLRIRNKLTLKEKGNSGITLFDDYHDVYLFLIDLIKAGYKARNKTIITDEAHQALRIV